MPTPPSRLPARRSPYPSSANRSGGRTLSLNLGPTYRAAQAPRKSSLFAGFQPGAFGTMPMMLRRDDGGGGGQTAAPSTPDLVPQPRPSNTGASTGGSLLVEDPNDYNNPLWKPYDHAYDVPPTKSEDPEDTDGGATGGNRGVDWGALMALLQSRMTSEMQGLNARGLARKKNILLGFGSRELASRVLGQRGPAFGNFGQYAPDMGGGNYTFQYNGGVPESNPGGSWLIVATRPDGSVTAQGQGGERNGETITFQASGFAPQQGSAGVGGDDPFFNLISDDPDKSTSTMAKINRAYRDRQKETNEELNSGNLWYSGGRGVALNQLNRSKLEDVDNATRDVQAELSSIDDEIAAIQRQWQDRIFEQMMAQFMNQAV